MSSFYQKHFLKLLDFTSSELTTLLQLAATLKSAKKNGTEEAKLTGKNIALIFEKTRLVHDALSKLPHMIKGHVSLISVQAVARSVIKNRLKIRLVFLVGCTTGFSIAATVRKLSKHWLNMREYLCGMA